jgi:hypothetical protein
MRAPLIVAAAGLMLIALPIFYAYLLPLCLLLALAAAVVRRCPELDMRMNKKGYLRRVLAAKSSAHVRYRIARRPWFIVLPRRRFE